MSDEVHVLYSGKDIYEFANEEEYQQALSDGDEIAVYGERILVLKSVPDISEDCTCYGKCSICINGLGRSQAVHQDCPDCPIHGNSKLAKSRQRDILERITMPDEKAEEVDINEKSIQDSIKTYSEESKNQGQGGIY